MWVYTSLVINLGLRNLCDFLSWCRSNSTSGTSMHSRTTSITHTYTGTSASDGRKEDGARRLVRMWIRRGPSECGKSALNNLGPVNCSEKNLVARPQQRSVRNEYYQPCLDPLQERQCPHRGDTGVKSDLQKSVHFEAGPKGRKGNKPLFTAIYRWLPPQPVIMWFACKL